MLCLNYNLNTDSRVGDPPQLPLYPFLFHVGFLVMRQCNKTCFGCCSHKVYRLFCLFVHIFFPSLVELWLYHLKYEIQIILWAGYSCLCLVFASFSTWQHTSGASFYVLSINVYRLSDCIFIIF